MQCLVLNVPCLPQASDLRIPFTRYPHSPEASCRDVLGNPGLLEGIPGGKCCCPDGIVMAPLLAMQDDMSEVDSNTGWRRTFLILSCQHLLSRRAFLSRRVHMLDCMLMMFGCLFSRRRHLLFRRSSYMCKNTCFQML